jgi:hypothetical protein
MDGIMSEAFNALLCRVKNGMTQKLLYFLLAMGVLVSCKKDNRMELFELNYFVDFEIPPGLSTIDTHIWTVSPLNSQFDSKLASSGHVATDVAAVEPKEGNLGSVFQDVNLDFIHRVSVYIFDPFHPEDKIEFFYLDPVPFKNKTVIQLFPGIANVQEWVESGFFGVEVRLDFREISPALTQMRLEFDLRAMSN